MEHVLIRRLEHLTGTAEAPSLGFAVEIRNRPGPAHKEGAAPDDVVWVQLHGGLVVARARTRGSALHDVDGFWTERPRYGYAAVASLQGERWLPEPFWAGPRTYGYEWVLLENEKKRSSWLDPREPPRGGNTLPREFRAWLRAR